MARAVGITAPGGPEVLTVIDREVRAAGPGEVRITVSAAAVNPTDIGLRAQGAGDLQPPWTPGMDAAGEIESVGEGVDRLTVGESVMAAVSPRRPEGGAQAELIIAPAASVVAIPDGASLDEAATLPMNGLTALRGLEMLGLAPGETLAVSGGAGVLGSYVIGLAREQGLRVIADARPEETELVRGFGADIVVQRSDDFSAAVRAEVPDGVAAVYDTALLNSAALPAIRDGGGLAVVRGWSEGEPPRGITVHPVMVRDVLERTEWLAQLRSLAGAGRLSLRVAGRYPPEQAAEAQRVM
ncbi:MAG: NADP-dependent oxidoreductase, partial [Solirubrobacteraceae bacterium]